MAVLFEKDFSVLLSHQKYIDSLYRFLKKDGRNLRLRLKEFLFSIKKASKSTGKRKRKLNTEEYLKEAVIIKETFMSFLNILPENFKSTVLSDAIDSSSVRDMSKGLLESINVDHCGLNGGNNCDDALVFSIKGDEFVAPPHSRFFCGDIKEQCLKLNGNKYNLVIADPPWWNKFIRRLKAVNNKLSYSMMYNEEIANIPIKDLLATNALVAIWCTNAPSNIDAVKNLILPKWGFEYVTTWYWMKITTDFKPICEFGTGHQKQPFERIIIGKVGNVANVPESKLIVSVPSALHSHKPPLLDILEPLLDEEPNTLELFARYLLPRTTSVGFEPLKWQHLSLYESWT